MIDWVLYKDAHPDLLDTDKAIGALTKSLPGFQEKWDIYIQENYKDYQNERLDYIDIGEHARCICEGVLADQINGFDKFFDTLELILNNCDETLENLMVVGLLESIQNICSGEKINIWTGFDIWLKPTTKKHWDNVIYFWEGNDAIERYKMEHPNNIKLTG